MRTVIFRGAGGNEVIHLEDRDAPTPRGREVAVRVRYAALNPADIRQREGLYPAPPGVVPDVPGLEVSGFVETRGGRETRWRVGDAVFGIVGGGGLAEIVVVHEALLAPAPATLTAPEASATPEAFIAAHDALRQGGVKSSDTLLVHGASGVVGSAAVQIARERGATVIATARSEPAKTFIRGLGAEAVDDEDFVDEVKRITRGRGADVILDLVGATHFPGNLDALALRGRVVIAGVPSGALTALDLRILMQRRAQLQGTVLRSRSIAEKARAVQAFEREVLPAIEAGRMGPTVDRVFPAEEVRQAFAHLATPGRTGKVLIDFG